MVDHIYTSPPSTTSSTMSSEKCENINSAHHSLEESTTDGPANFETAISASGFGKFNVLLFLVTIPAGWTAIFETITMSYVYPAAQCDLNLTLHDKGLLNSITFTGMITSGFIWGFLYDAFGRKRLLAIGFLLDGFFMMLSSFSQNVPMLIVAKFFGGVIVNGPNAALITYISEFHGVYHRSKMNMYRGMIANCGSVVIPLLAWAILPQDINYTNSDNTFVYHSWNFFLLICSLPSLISGIIFLFLPETPKYLMSIGEERKALEVFRMVYRFNTGKESYTYPVKELKMPKIKEKVSTNKFTSGIKQMFSLFRYPHLGNILLICSIQFFNKASLNPLKLWLPQIFQAISDYQMIHEGSSASLCSMIQELQPTNVTKTCTVFLGNPLVYINNIVAAFVSIIGYIIAGSFIHIINEHLLIKILGIITGTLAISIYFAQNTASTVTLTSLTMAFGGICSYAVVSIAIDLFPTRLRATSVSLIMTSNRFGSMIGNLMFPVLLQMGCAPIFFTIGAAVICTTFLTYLIPDTDYEILD